MTEPNEPQAPPAATELSDDELDSVVGGVRVLNPPSPLPKTPSPGGPLPIPYPNVTKE